MKTVPLYLAAAILLFPAMGALAATMRCDNGLISTGDTAMVVTEKCGEPASRQVTNPAVDGVGHVVRGAATVERWVYGPTNGMSYHLRFIDGRLAQIRSQR
ncbi:Protein of unknown function [Halopseudomonas litoralis]|uniref:DUF2845 domain-containing protein n=1 Tax=Halopseudomonas litoralis TaxID=797277 RepID=A0A1H1WLW6_9GAMM|nr:DUF2845 domain-containing protein [Halopseudomonas litoralis]SDS98044.1 Protein of unknown function [Halopseudomonas litoralis]